ncbi:hypothetical protein E8E14_000478 [Neopestalotiopsis sp. 37M]|nr:hypothetical protein E8E14_000478 [Neopestalotiopsis sp. 37M]
MFDSKALLVVALSLSSCSLVTGQILSTVEVGATSTATKTTTATTASATACTTNVLGLASPQPSGAVCGVAAVSNGGTTIISYTSGTYIFSVENCKNICLTTEGCTNIYFAEGQYCNLHSGLETHVATSGSIYEFYDSSCFICPSTCGQSGYVAPSDAICNEPAVSNGGTTIISYTSGAYIESIDACSAICLQTSGCTNLYFDSGAYCNLHAGNQTAVANSGATASSTTASSASSSSSTSAVKTTISTSITTSATSDATGTPWISIETDVAKYSMALTTTYTQSPQCTGSITQMAYHGTNLWENAINPVPTSTITTCYPSQFYSSVMAELNSISLPAFSTLVCPTGWKANLWNETYGACCPSDFGVYAPYITDYPDRPFYYAACTSNMPANRVYELTSYDSTAYLTTISTAAPSTGTMVRVNAFDGFITGIPTSTVTSTGTAATSSASSCATPAATVSMTFEIDYTISSDFDGESIIIVGSTDELGSWNVSNGLAMSSAFYTRNNPMWDLTVALNASESIEYQYVLSFANGTNVTTSEPYYNLTVSDGCPSTQSITDIWR